MKQFTHLFFQIHSRKNHSSSLCPVLPSVDTARCNPLVRCSLEPTMRVAFQTLAPNALTGTQPAARRVWHPHFGRVAPEALSYKRFSERSDVWSYGVLLWEIWSCGAVPYSDWTNEKVWLEVSNGFRLQAPQSASPLPLRPSRPPLRQGEHG